ncbi:conserved hypothetical protein [Mesorhizobium plurifarium]|uniref:NACHT domain-containing protein n=1 Tax=Mesorhizobium plurifarium TaxID=69974 RepID=A0A0K2VNP4_MESPL|nr:conserved hypothetical protein [Mesorhizobium plurifarium]
MGVASYELTRLDSNTFEHLANMLALKVLGSGHTGFGPGPDAGRDGYFEGTTDYPSTSENWSGTWYIQSKFHAPHLSTDPQKWLLDQINQELKAFSASDTTRRWPDNWIIITNIDPSGSAGTGSFDRAVAAVKKVRPRLAKRFHIWGGRKVLDLLALNKDIADYYAEFVTPGVVITEIYKSLLDSTAKTDEIIRYLVVSQLTDQQFTKLEQAGSSADNRPGIQQLFTDLPFAFDKRYHGMAVRTLATALAQKHIVDGQVPSLTEWKAWQRNPARARIWFVKGGPGQGKSTLTQYICQIQRAALLRSSQSFNVTPAQHSLAEDIRTKAVGDGLWPIAPRIPISVELKTFARWVGEQNSGSYRVLAYLTNYLSNELGQSIVAGTLKRAFGQGRWLFVFDGLDEVPGDVKDRVAAEVVHFVDDVLVGCKSDAAIVCTSRPQGYAGQFDVLEAATIELTSLSKDQALKCASPLLRIERSAAEGEAAVKTLKDALSSPAIAEIMTTPLQAHIMAVIVRDGGRPPDRKWQLFNTFYSVIKKREANRNLLDPLLSKILREGDRLIKTLHNRLGFELHSRAETSGGATTSLARDEFRSIVEEVVSSLQDKDVDATVAALMLAATDRLVLVSTPESGEYVRFDIRPLQEFFAAEQIYESAEPSTLIDRFRLIVGDSHWREVMHFLLSALVENQRKAELISIAAVMMDLDEGDENDIRALSRKLARGGILTARLLSEGVLEQDKRIRTLFGKCLTGLLSSLDAGVYLWTVRSDHSLNWLIDVLLTTMREQSESEALGAAVSLARLLPSSDTRCGEAKSLIRGCSSDFIAQLLEAISSPEPRKEVSISPWITSVAIEILMDGKWYEHGERAIRACIGVLSLFGPSLPQYVTFDGVGKNLTMAMHSFLATDMERRKIVRSIRFNTIEVERWEAGKELDWTKWTPTFWRAFSRSSGILKSIYLLFKFLRSRSRGDAMALFESVGGTNNLSLLPAPVRGFVDCNIARRVEDSGFSKVDRLIVPEDAREDQVIYYSHASARRNTRDAIVDNTDWEAFLEQEPQFALDVIIDTGSTSERLASLLRRRDIISAIRGTLENEWTYRYMLSKVGRIKDNFPELSDAILHELVQKADNPVLVSYYGGETAPFLMDLAWQSKLLPHVLAGCLDSVGHNRFAYRREHLPPRQQLSVWVGQYVPQVDDLRNVHRDTGQLRRIRTAARILECLHPDFQDNNPTADEIESMYELAESYWYLRGVGMVLSDAIKTADASAWRSMSKLLEVARTDYHGKSSLTNFIRGWRELALAPVTRANNPQLWV